MLIPLSAIAIAPTLKVALSDERNVATSAISSGLSERLMGVFCHAQRETRGPLNGMCSGGL